MLNLKFFENAIKINYFTFQIETQHNQFGYNTHPDVIQNWPFLRKMRGLAETNNLNFNCVRS